MQSAKTARRCCGDYRRRGFTLIEVMIVIAIMSLLMILSVPAIQASREAARRTQCSNNQHQFGVAFLNFESHNKAFPSSITLRAKGPLVSDPEWHLHNFMADLLPFLEEHGVSAGYRRDSMFCSEPNRAAIATPLTVAICPSAPRDTVTSATRYIPSLRVPPSVRTIYANVFASLDSKYDVTFDGAAMDYGVPVQAEDGVATLFGYEIAKNDPAGLPSMFPSPLNQKSARVKWESVLRKPGTADFIEQTRSSQITDGLSRTFMLTEIAGRPQHWQMGARTPVGEPLPNAWADPNAVTFEIKSIQTDRGKCVIQCGNSGEHGDIDPEIYSFHSGGVTTLFADGHVESLSPDIDSRVLLSLMTPARADNERQ